MKTLLLLLSAATLLSAAEKPNIIFIMADDQGYGDASSYNPESKIPTPGIDRIAKEGIRFTDAHSGSAVCTPTRYGLLTGRYSWRSRLQGGVMVTGEKGGGLIAPSTLTVPEWRPPSQTVAPLQAPNKRTMPKSLSGRMRREERKSESINQSHSAESHESHRSHQMANHRPKPGSSTTASSKVSKPCCVRDGKSAPKKNSTSSPITRTRRRG